MLLTLPLNFPLNLICSMSREKTKFKGKLAPVKPACRRAGAPLRNEPENAAYNVGRPTDRRSVRYRTLAFPPGL
jgi:hypothetical protein